MLSLDQIVGLLSHNAYLVLLPLSIVEGPIVTLVCGFLISIGQLNPLLTFGIVVAGDLIGDAILYSLGRSGSGRLMSVWRKEGRTATRARKLKDQLLSKADRMLIVGKLTHAIGAPVLLAAGMVRMPFVRFMAVNLGATLLKSFALLVAGYWIGASYPVIVGNPLYLSGALLLLGAAILYLLVFRRHAAKAAAEADRPEGDQQQNEESPSPRCADVTVADASVIDPNQKCSQSPSILHSEPSQAQARAA